MPWKHSCHYQTWTVAFKIRIFLILRDVHHPILIWCNILDSILLVFYTHVGALALALSAVPWLPQSPAQCACCLSSYPENKLHWSWACLLLNPANTFSWGFAAPLEPSLWYLYLGPVSLPGMITLISVLLLTAEIFSPSQPNFSHLSPKEALSELMGLGNSTKRKSKLFFSSGMIAKIQLGAMDHLSITQE